jgi:hypothetical protein
LHRLRPAPFDRDVTRRVTPCSVKSPVALVVTFLPFTGDRERSAQ